MAQCALGAMGTQVTDQYTLQQERYVACLKALVECLHKGVSSRAIAQLSFECGVSIRDLDNLFNNEEAK
jgi:hypothetical protein